MTTYPSRERVLEVIETHAPEVLKAALRDNLAPAIALILQKTDDENIAVGQSKIGGAPDVPLGFEWPHWKDKPLGFVVQFNLQEVAPFNLNRELPLSGTLSFFYAIGEQPWGFAEDKGAWQVFFWSGAEALQRSRFVNVESDILQTHTIEFCTEWQAPKFWALRLAGCEIGDLDDETQSQQLAFEDALHDLQPKSPKHQLLGFAEPIQDDLPTACCMTLNKVVRAKGESDASFSQKLRELDADKWRLLFQLDSQHNRVTYKEEWMWGDAGMIYFCIHEDALKARNFDSVWLQLQCG